MKLDEVGRCWDVVSTKKLITQKCRDSQLSFFCSSKVKDEAVSLPDTETNQGLVCLVSLAMRWAPKKAACHDGGN